MTRPARRRRASTTRALHEALDLCLECRACKSECPTSVDMARIKSEVLADQWRRHGAPTTVRAFGHVAPAGALGQPSGAVGQRRRRQRPRRVRSTEAVAGIDRRRVPPVWSRRTLSGALPRHARSPVTPAPCSSPTRSPSTRDPDIGVAAFERARPRRHRRSAGAARLLRAAAHLAGPAGATRARSAGATVDALHAGRRARRGHRLPGAELPVGAARGRAVAAARRGPRAGARPWPARACCSRSIVEDELRAGPARPCGCAPGPRTVLLHPHCHQRSMGLAGAAAHAAAPHSRRAA